MIGQETLSTWNEVQAMRARLTTILERDDADTMIVVGYEDFEEQEV